MNVSVKSPIDLAAQENHEPFSAYLADDSSIQKFASVIAERGWNQDRIIHGGAESAIRSLASLPSPVLLIVDFSGSDDPMIDINSLAEVCEPGTIVIAIGDHNDVNLYRDMVHAGIHDYLVKPVSVEQFRGVIESAENSLAAALAPPEDAEETGAFVTNIIGVRGGAGSSMLATNAAWLLGEEFGQKVALLDLDVYFGSDALAFDLEPGRGLWDALENPSRVDGLFLGRAAIKYTDHLSILGAEAPLNQSLKMDSDAIGHLLEQLKSTFTQVVIDLPRALMREHSYLVSQANHNVIISELTLASMRDTIRLLAFLREHAPKVAVSVVLNKVGVKADSEVTQKDFETAVEQKVDWLIPLDTRATVISAKTGKVLVEAAKSSKISAALRNLCKQISGLEEKKSRIPAWKKFLQSKKSE